MRRRGNVVVAVAAGALLFVGLLALVVDVGSWTNDRLQAQAIVDVAAETALRRHPEDPAGDAARATCLMLFHDNQTAPYALELRSEGPGQLRVEVGLERPRLFSAYLSPRGVRLVVAAQALRDTSGRVRLAP